MESKPQSSVEDVQVTDQHKEGPGKLEIDQLAKTDPMAALMANIPHKSRHIAESALREISNPSKRHERSDAEIARGLPGRTITRDIKTHIKFLRARFYPENGEREVTRRLRQAKALASK